MDIPRALSASEDDPRWRPDVFAIAADLLIRLDGKEQTKVLTYDIDEGLIVRGRLNEQGRMHLNEAGDAFEVEAVRGVVTVESKQ